MYILSTFATASIDKYRREFVFFFGKMLSLNPSMHPNCINHLKYFEFKKFNKHFFLFSGIKWNLRAIHSDNAREISDFASFLLSFLFIFRLLKFFFRCQCMDEGFDTKYTQAKQTQIQAYINKWKIRFLQFGCIWLKMKNATITS